MLSIILGFLPTDRALKHFSPVIYYKLNLIFITLKKYGRNTCVNIRFYYAAINVKRANRYHKGNWCDREYKLIFGGA